MKHIAYLSLGSNLGDRVRNLQQAVAALGAAGVQVTGISSIYETEPVDYTDQAWFLNLAVAVETEMAPVELLQTTQRIEAQMGRKKTVPKGPRLIDLDILLYDDEIIDLPELQIPHPAMHLRRFVLRPLTEIAPEARHPGMHQSIAELLAQSMDSSAVRILGRLQSEGRTRNVDEEEK